MTPKKVIKTSTQSDVAAFLNKVSINPLLRKRRAGRLIFALDATASREPSWDHACRLQGEMFSETSEIGGLEVQLVYFRGFSEFIASPWTNDTQALLKQMTGVRCLAGETQISKVLNHTIHEADNIDIDALVYIGDSFEEDVDKIGGIAGKLGLLGVPAFIFQEGYDTVAEFAFRQIAKLSNGAFCRLDEFSAKNLSELLRAVAIFAAGGRLALEEHADKEGGAFLQIARQIKNK